MVFDFGNSQTERGPDHFVVIDVETANTNRGSICQIGIAEFDNWVLVDKWDTYVNPQCKFYDSNIAVHQITPDLVQDSPPFERVYDDVKQRLADRLVVSHTFFDRDAITEAATSISRPLISCNWVDSSTVVRRVWPEYSTRGYGLGNLKQRFSMDFKHHDALEDAIAAGEIFCMAAKKTGLGAIELGKMSAKRKPRNTYGTKVEKKEGHLNSPLSGHVCVLSGDFPRDKNEVANILNGLGAAIHPGITKKTTILIVGDLSAPPTGKVKKAQEYIEKGLPIQITDLGSLVDQLRE
jgi:DNA polymerase-3 subunit epsilon